MTQFKGQKPLKDDDVKDAPAGQQASVGTDADRAHARPHAPYLPGWHVLCMTYGMWGRSQ